MVFQGVDHPNYLVHLVPLGRNAACDVVRSTEGKGYKDAYDMLNSDLYPPLSIPLERPINTFHSLDLPTHLLCSIYISTMLGVISLLFLLGTTSVYADLARGKYFTM